MDKKRKLTFLLFLLAISAIPGSAFPQEETNISLNISDIISISDIVAPYYSKLAAEEKIPSDIAAVSASWSPDGSKILVRPLSPEDLIFDALYILNADGTEIKEFVATHDNTKSRTLQISSVNEHDELALWSPDLNRFVFSMNMYSIKEFYLIADENGNVLRVPGTNFSTIKSIRNNIPKISSQRCFRWNPNGKDAAVIMNDQLYIVDRDGFVLQKLTNESIEKSISNCMWDHKGETCAFIGEHLWIINRDGTGLKQIASNAGQLIGWSLDDSKLYYSDVENGSRSQSVISVNDSTATKISTGGLDDYLVVGPAGKILFTNTTYDEEHLTSSSLYVANDDGSYQKLLGTNNSVNAYYAYLAAGAKWSPQGDKIATAFEIINSDGNGTKKIELGPNFSWHPSGNYIVFNSYDKRGDNYFNKVCVAKSDGSEVTQISPKDDYSYSFSGWSPDGSRLLITRSNNTDYNEELLLVKFSDYDEIMSLDVPDSIIKGQNFSIFVKSMSQPVQNAHITLDGVEIGMSNETGCVNYTIPKPGTYVLNASKEGYVDSSILFFVQDKASLRPHEYSKENTDQNSSKLPGFSLSFGLVSLCVAYLGRRIK